MDPIPITIVTGFLGSGKTTLILNLIPQLPKDYRLALLKNEYGDVAVDSLLASSAAISGVQELLNGCICCNLVGQLGDALETLLKDVKPDRIIIETSGSAFPATLAMEVNRLARESSHYALDGVVSVIDVENWKGYEDTSYTANMQAKYTDLIIFNKWELVEERRYEDCLDRVGDLDVQVPIVKSDKGMVSQTVLLGIDSSLAKAMLDYGRSTDHSDAFSSGHNHAYEHDHGKDHQSEVEVLSCVLSSPSSSSQGVDLQALDNLLHTASKEEVYRIKGVVLASVVPKSSDGQPASSESSGGGLKPYLLNWAFGRWTFTVAPQPEATMEVHLDKIIRITIVTARDESDKWRWKLLGGGLLMSSSRDGSDKLEIRKSV